MATAKKLCLIIRPTGKFDPEVRKRVDLLLRFLVTPALEECGYLPVRADKISEAGVITNQIIQHVLDEPLVVADLTGLSAEVFYALALRHAVRKPLVQLAKRGEKLPFELAGMNVIEVEHTDLESVSDAKAEIIRQIKAAEGRAPEHIESPVSTALQLQHLQENGNSCERSMLEVLSFVNNLREDLLGRLSAIERRLAEPRPAPPFNLADHHLLRVSRQGAQDEMDALFAEIGRIEGLIAPLQSPSGNDGVWKQSSLREAQARLAALRERGEMLRASPKF